MSSDHLPKLNQKPRSLQNNVDPDATTPLVSWSMAKSIPYARIGLVQGDGLLELDVVALLMQWGIEAQNELYFFDFYFSK